MAKLLSIGKLFIEIQYHLLLIYEFITELVIIRIKFEDLRTTVLMTCKEQNLKK